MDITELEKWIETTEDGRAWADKIKQPLLNKRDELLAELKTANGILAESERRFTVSAEELSQERAATSTFLVDQGLAHLLKETRVMESAIPSIIAELKESNAITVKADGLNRKAVGMATAEDGTEQEKSLAEIVSAWAATPAAKQVILNSSTGGGALGSTGNVHSAPALGKLSGPALAKMSDAEFHAARQSAMTAQGD
jgi:hypothetical protein